MSTGEIASPYTLAEALASTKIKPGQTLYLRGGVYTGDFVSTLGGANGSPITIKPYGTEKPIIDGSVTINGNDTTWQNLEIRYSGWSTRVSSQSGSTPTDIPTGTGLQVYGARTVIDGCYIHDVANIGFWIQAVGATFQNNLILNQGWDAPDRGHGHGVYTQNRQAKKTIKRNVFAGGYSGYGLHGYTQGSYVQQYDIIENISLAQSNIMQGGANGVDGIVATSNVLYGGDLSIGTGGSTNGTVTVANTEQLNSAAVNHYGSYTGYSESDGNSTLGNRQISIGRFLVVCNAAGAASVSAPSAGTYTNALNPAESVVLEAGAALAMTGWTVATPTGAASPILTTTFPSFGVFILS